MYLLRAILIWVLALSLPVEGMAASVMTHCKDMQKAVAGTTVQGMNHHDHAAMMAAMSDDSSMMHMQHHDKQADSARKSSPISKLGCNCGCKCGGNCALSCAAMMMPVMQSRFTLNEQGRSSLLSLQVGQAHAAYRYDPLRPPSAVAL